MSNGYDELPPDAPPPQTGGAKRMATDRDRLIDRSNPIAEEGFFDGMLRPCLSEFIGTALFVYIGTMSAVQGNVTAIALAHGFTIAILVAGIGPISGGHFNPAVTLGVYLAGGIPTLKAIVYFISQLVGGILGSAFTRGVLGETAFKLIRGGAHDLGTDTSPSEGLLCEVLLTSLLVTVILLTAVDPIETNCLASVAIGFAVVVDILAGATISGASMNPARSFGPAVVVSKFDSDVWNYHYIYWVGPALGALLSAVWYRLFLARPEKRMIEFSKG